VALIRRRLARRQPEAFFWIYFDFVSCGSGPAQSSIVEITGRGAREPGIADVQVLSSVPAHSFVTIRTSDQHRMDLAIGQTLP
jgi:hypothetical protein